MVSFKSFSYAFKGLKYVLSSERNARLHLLLAVLALVASIALRIGLEEWLFVVISISLVFFAEKTLDLISQENNQMVKLIKDMMAAGVLVTAFGAVVVAVIIFVPRLILLIEGVVK